MLALLDARAAARNGNPGIFYDKPNNQVSWHQPFIPILEKHTERFIRKLNGKQFSPKPIKKVWIIDMCPRTKHRKSKKEIRSLANSSRCWSARKLQMHFVAYCTRTYLWLCLRSMSGFRLNRIFWKQSRMQNRRIFGGRETFSVA